MQTITRTSYDQVPYPSVPLRRTHPETLSTIASLFGLSASPAEACRVLEIGCADGANLIPMACNLPGSTFVGIDLSPQQVARGQRMAHDLGLTNLTLHALDVMDVDARFGMFDYIIIYGVFSWVPQQVQEKILQVCQQQLAPSGVALISYNTYPGWHMRASVREMLLYHVQQFPNTQTRIDQARAMLNFLSTAAPQVVGRLPENKAYGLILESEQQRISTQTDSYLLHELLEEYNEPFYFQQFASRAAQHGLQYLSEAELSTMLPDMLPPEVAETIGKLGHDIVATEQYLDFVRNRMFRQTLLCRAEVNLERAWGPETIARYTLASSLKPLSDQADFLSASVEKFRLPGGTTVTSANPLIKAAFLILSQKWPFAVSFDQLLREARGCSRSSASLEADAQVLEDTLLKSLAVDLVELNLYPPRFVPHVSECPRASAIARYQATHDEQITNQRHEAVEVDITQRRLLSLLDGTRTHADLAHFLPELTCAPESGRPPLVESLEDNLRALARAALLVA